MKICFKCLLKKPLDAFYKHPKMTDRHLARHAEEGIFSLKQTPGECLCLVKGCKNESNRLKFSLCHKHYQYRWRILSPKKSTYATLRDHAKARGLEFTIDFSYFCGMADAFAYFDSNAEERGEFPSLTFRPSLNTSGSGQSKTRSLLTKPKMGLAHSKNSKTRNNKHGWRLVKN